MASFLIIKSFSQQMNQSSSEKFRKYIIELIFSDGSYYTVWGTDMSDPEEPDLLLVRDNKIIVFNSPAILKEKLAMCEDAYFDNSNIQEWLNEEKFFHSYTSYNFELINKISPELLKQKEESLALLDIINLMEDFYIQINNMAILKVLKSPELVILKDFIYDNYLWKRSAELKYTEPDLLLAKGNLQQLYKDFRSNIH